jgi:signal transduction histidine kinase
MVALTWLGLHVLQQDREIEQQRRRDRLEVEAGRLALDLERQLEESEDLLARGGGIRMLPNGLSADGSVRVLYQPDAGGDLPVEVAELAAAEALEFSKRDLPAAIRAYQPFTRASDGQVRAAALVALARVLRQTNDRAGALRAYDDLERLGSIGVGGQPAALIALQGRCKIFDAASDAERFRLAVNTLGDAINSGAWSIDRGTFGLYRDLLDRWGAPPTPPDALLRTEAAIRIWESWRGGDLPPRGRRIVRTDRGAALTLWAGDRAASSLAVATAADIDEWIARLRNPLALRVTVFETDGTRFAGADPAAAGLSLAPGETHLPFVLSIAAASDALEVADTSRRRLVIGGLVGVFALLLAAAYGLYRATSRELQLARQQSDFVSAVSHEFRTPLTSMRHLTDLLVSRNIASEDRRVHYYQLLAHETERLYRMVESLLSFGRIEAGAYAFRLEPVDAGEVVRAVVDEFRVEPLARGREIASDVDLPLPSILADRETLSRALWNLVENAAKYSEPGTPIRIFATRRDDFVLLGVGDNGTGIAPDERNRIFEKFVRGADATRAGVGGVGIGLALVKRIAEAHGGSVRVDSEPGRGSTFTLVLPCHAC